MTDQKNAGPTDANNSAPRDDAGIKEQVAVAEVEGVTADPYPSQADIDAIREGTYSAPEAKKKRDLKPSGGTNYKTR